MKRPNNLIACFIAIICVIILVAAMCSCGNSGIEDISDTGSSTTTTAPSMLDDGFGTEVGM